MSGTCRRFSWLPAAFVAGSVLALELDRLSLAWPALLLALGVALGGRRGLLVAAFAAGLLNAGAREALPRRVPGPGLGRPVTLVGPAVGRWVVDEDGWRGRMRVQMTFQGSTVSLWSDEVLLSGVPGDGPPAGSVRARGILRRAPGLGNVPATPQGPFRLRVEHPVLFDQEGPRGVSGWTLLVRRRMVGWLESGAATPGTALAEALVLGRSEALPESWRRGLRRAGLSHLLAVSGLHLAIVGGGAWWALRRRRRGERALGALILMSGYALLVGPRPAVLRALVMGVAFVAARAVGRPTSTLDALGAGAALMVLVRPALVLDLSWRLTVAATLGIVVLSPALLRRWSGTLPEGLVRALSVSVAAQLATLPILGPLKRQVSTVAPWANLVAVPWTALALSAGLLGLPLRALLPALAPVIDGALDAIAAPFGWPARFPPGRFTAVALPGGATVALSTAALVAAILLAPRRIGWLTLVLPLAIVVAVGGRPAGAPELVVFDVGQGDAILLRDGPEAVLVDGGGWRRGDLGGKVLVPALIELGVRRLAALIPTHPDTDHCAGLVDVAGRLPVDEVWMTPGWGGDPCIAALWSLPGTPGRVWWRGDERSVGRWRLKVLHPPPGGRVGRNERSLVLWAGSGGHRFLLTGDVGSPEEEELLAMLTADGEDLAGVVLKVAHHGSRGATGEPLLARLQPSLALISAGRGNLYGHPSAPTLERLRRHGVRHLRTDRDGMIHVGVAAGRPLTLRLPGSPKPDADAGPR